MTKKGIYFWNGGSFRGNSDTSAPLPPRPLVTSAPSHLGPTTTSAPVWKKKTFSGRPLVTSAPSHFSLIFIVTSAPSYNSIILMKRKKERKKYTASKKEPDLLLHNLMICVYTFHQRKKEGKKERKKERNKERNKQTKKMACAPRKTQKSLGIRPVWSVFAVRMKKAWVLTYPLSAYRRLWSDWVDAQADLSLRWAQRSFCWFSHEAAHIL